MSNNQVGIQRICWQLILLVLIAGCGITLWMLMDFIMHLPSLSSYVPLNVTGTPEVRHLTDPCNVSCPVGIPCEYSDELDLRVIVMTYNRPDSLNRCLSYVAKLDTFDDDVGVDIWIDRAKDGSVDQRTVNISRSFQEQWKNGRVCVHVRERNAYIIGQWVDTWRPRENSRELALLLEDDIDISPLSYRWLKLMDSRFRSVPDVAGYTLQMENVNFVKKRHNRPVRTVPRTHNVFLYRLIGTWGYSPKPNQWRNFQDWFHEVRNNKTFRPYIADISMTDWFKMFEKRGTADSMWEMWVIYYHYINNLYTVYSNLQGFTGRKDILLDTNRREAGLHWKQNVSEDRSKLLLTKWKKEFETFPEKILRYDFDGTSHNAVTG